MLIYLDIETLPTNDAEVIADIAATVKPPANYSKPETIAKWMEENKANAVADLVAKTSFDGMYGSIACICYAFDDGEVFTVDSRNGEREMLDVFFSHIQSETSNERHGGSFDAQATFVGHNLVAFDLPFIKHRAIIHAIKPPMVLRKAFAAKPWSNEVADTMLMWSSDPHKRGSMDRICKALGLGGKGDFDGSMVAETWPVDPVKVIKYCIEDVERTRKMYKRINFDF